MNNDKISFKFFHLHVTPQVADRARAPPRIPDKGAGPRAEEGRRSGIEEPARGRARAMFVNRGGASASTSCLKASPALPRRRASRGPRLGARDSGLRRPLRTRDRLGRAGRGTQAAEGSGREAAITGDLVAPQMSEVEETTIVEDGASRIIFRIGGLIDVREVEELTEKVGGRSYPPPPPPTHTHTHSCPIRARGTSC